MSALVDGERIEFELDVTQDAVLSIRRYRSGVLVDEPRWRDGSASHVLIDMAKRFPRTTLCWFDARVAKALSPTETWPGLLSHGLEIRFYPGPGEEGPVLSSLSLVHCFSAFLMSADECPQYPSWLVSPLAGVCRAALVAAFDAPDMPQPLSITLIEIARRAMVVGACPYADSRLVREPERVRAVARETDPSWADMAGHIARLSRRSSLIWVLGLAYWQRRFPLLSSVRALLNVKRMAVDEGELVALRPVLKPPPPTIDVDAVIPTLERPQHLVRVLEDLAAQDHPLRRVHVIAQGEGSVPHGVPGAEWPFELHLVQVSWVGACRARNQGIENALSEWVLLADDDVRLPPDYVSHLLAVAVNYGVEIVNVCPPGIHSERVDGNFVDDLAVWSFFLSGFALCSRQVLIDTKFHPYMEGIIYEDYELGVRARRSGSHAIVTRKVAVENIAAQTGGFRSEQIPGRKGLPGRVRPILAVYLLLSRLFPRPMKIGFKIDYVIGQLVHTPLWKWPLLGPKILNQWRTARAWYKWTVNTNGKRM